MLRTIIWLLASILLITFIRGVIGLLAKGVGQLFQEEAQQARQAKSQPSNQKPAAGFGGELVQDPVCGVFVSPTSSPKITVSGATHYFCSTACRDKFTA